MLINFVDATNDANHYTKPPDVVYDRHTHLYLSAGCGSPACERKVRIGRQL